MAETKDKSRTVAAAFGQEIDLSDLEGFDIQELLDVNTDLLKVEGGDPSFEYGWMDVRDPAHAYKLRKGLWEQVNAETDKVICAGAIRDDNKAIRVNELMLVKMPREKFQRMRLAWDAVTLAKQAKIDQRYKAGMEAAGKPWGADTDPVIVSDEKVGVSVKYKGKQ